MRFLPFAAVGPRRPIRQWLLAEPQIGIGRRAD